MSRFVPRTVLGITLLACIWATSGPATWAADGLNEEEMQAWSRHVRDCGEFFQYMASHGVERSAFMLKAKLLENAENVGATRGQLEVLDQEFDSGRTLARQDGYGTGRYARELRSREGIYLGIMAFHASNYCTEWTYVP